MTQVVWRVSVPDQNPGRRQVSMTFKVYISYALSVHGICLVVIYGLDRNARPTTGCGVSASREIHLQARCVYVGIAAAFGLHCSLDNGSLQ